MCCVFANPVLILKGLDSHSFLKNVPLMERGQCKKKKTYIRENTKNTGNNYINMVYLIYVSEVAARLSALLLEVYCDL